jgi:transposase
MTDEAWALIAPFMPARKRTGRPRTTALRDVVDAILYMAATGCQWAMIPNDLPPPSTLQRYFYDWRDSGLLATINHHLVQAARELEGVPGFEIGGDDEELAGGRRRSIAWAWNGRFGGGCG